MIKKSLKNLFLANLLITLVFPVAATQTIKLELTGTDGLKYQLSDYTGKWVVLNLWATWCPPCLEEIPELSLFHEKYHQDQAVVLGINFEEVGEIKLKNFIEEQFIDYPILKMKPASSTPMGRVMGLPTTFIISPDGQLAKTHVGAVTLQDLEQYTRQSTRTDER